MKKLALIAAFTILANGCVTSQEDPLLRHYRTGSKLAAYLAASVNISNNYNDKEIYIQVRDLLEEKINQDTLTYEDFIVILNRLPITQMQSRDTTILINSAYIIFEDIAGSFEVKNPLELRAVATGVAQGFNMAIVTMQQMREE